MSELQYVGIREIVDILAMRKKDSGHTVLVLGSRAGGLYHSEDFYNQLMQFSNRDIHNLTQKQQFSACYEILNRGHLSERDIYIILKAALIDLSNSPAETYLADLTKAGYFKEIISANIDDRLEKAFNQVAMKEQRDYEIFSANDEKLRHYDNESSACRVLKVYGDLFSRVYNINRGYAHIENSPLLNGILQKSLAKDVLISGFDPTWDEGLLRVITMQKTDSTLWFVDDEEPEDHHIKNTLVGRKAKCAIETEGSYDNLIPTLHKNLIGYTIAPENRFSELIAQHETLQASMQKMQSRMNTLQDHNDLLQQNMKKLQENVSAFQERQDSSQKIFLDTQKTILAEIKKSQKRQRNGPGSHRNL